MCVSKYYCNSNEYIYELPLYIYIYEYVYRDMCVYNVFLFIFKSDSGTFSMHDTFVPLEEEEDDHGGLGGFLLQQVLLLKVLCVELGVPLLHRLCAWEGGGGL
jgi:hypothetical protein